MDELFRLSLALTTWLQEHYPQLLWLMTIITSLGQEVAYLAILPAVYWSVDKRFGRQLGYVFLLSAVVNSTAKNLLRQPRPFWLDPGVRLSSSESYGLPSGHAQHATSVYLLVAGRLRRNWVWLLAFLGIVVMSLSRLYLGVHFLQDVVGGFILGLLVLFAFLFWQQSFAQRFGRSILGRRLLLMILIPAALAAVYGLLLLIIGRPNLDVPWASFVPAAERTAHEDVVSTLASLLGFGIGMTLESSRVRFRADGPAWQRVARYVLGIAVALAIWGGLRIIFPAEPEWLGLPLRFLRYLLLLLWVTYFAPWVFIRLRLATADAESEVRISLWA